MSHTVREAVCSCRVVLRSWRSSCLRCLRRTVDRRHTSHSNCQSSCLRFDYRVDSNCDDWSSATWAAPRCLRSCAPSCTQGSSSLPLLLILSSGGIRAPRRYRQKSRRHSNISVLSCPRSTDSSSILSIEPGRFHFEKILEATSFTVQEKAKYERRRL